jgi:hypothetical protein
MTLLHAVAETPSYLRDARGLSDDERKTIVDAVARSPRGGAEVVGSGGVRKVRIAGRGKGKSGGYRVMIAYVGGDAPVYLLALLSKGERANFTKSEISGFKALTSQIRTYWKRRRK